MRNKIMLTLVIISVVAFTACERPAFIQEYLGPTETDQDFTVLPPGEGLDVAMPAENTNNTNVSEMDNVAESTETPTETPESEVSETEGSETTGTEMSTKEPTKESTEIDTDKYVKKVVFEGDLVSLTPKAVDPDGDKIQYSFSPPLDETGEWQTKKGDAGQYLVDITASDGKLETTQKILIVVQSTNTAPTITGLEDMTVKEGDTVNLDFTVDDADGDDVTVTISGWMDEETYETTYKDAGEHKVTVKANDGEDETQESITITVENVNRAPAFSGVKDIEAVEEDEIKLLMDATDPDGDDVELTYSEPFDKNGEWQTKVGDAGEYDVTITASDGTDETEATLKVTVKSLNKAPVFEELEDITVNEGETVKINPVVNDPDGDKVDITYSGWMDQAEYTTTFDDAGEYTVTVTASDGKASVSRDVGITVINKNRPPEFVLVG